MSLLLTLAACGLLGSGEPEVDPAECASQATALSQRLTADARVLAAHDAHVEEAARRAKPAVVEVPLRPSGASDPVIVLELDGEVAVGATAGVAMDSEGFAEALEEALSGVHAPAPVSPPADLAPDTREAWEAWSAAVASPAPTVVLDARAPGAAVAELLQALHEAGASEVELVVALSDPPQVDPGVAHPDGNPWAGCDYGWAQAVADAPMAMRPWLYADRATTAFASCGCAPQADQVTWHLSSTFKVPEHAAVRVRLEPRGHELVASVVWANLATRVVAAAQGGGGVWLVPGEGRPVPQKVRRGPAKAGKMQPVRKLSPTSRRPR